MIGSQDVRMSRCLNLPKEDIFCPGRHILNQCLVLHAEKGRTEEGSEDVRITSRSPQLGQCHLTLPCETRFTNLLRSVTGTIGNISKVAPGKSNWIKDMRQCQVEVQVLTFLKTKVLVLFWRRLNLTSWCQNLSDINSFSYMYDTK